MKKNYWYVVIFGWAGNCAECVTIVKAPSLKILSDKGFTKNPNRDFYRFNSEKEAENWIGENMKEYPKQRIKYWV